jgi:hypothetical protein
MKILTVITALLATVLVVTTQPTEAGVSISVGEPGFYGRVDIGNYPPPRLIYEEPVIVRRVKTWYPPIYLRVPPGHVNQWYKHCDRYEACGRPVYFIQDDWYREVYVPRYREYRYEGGYSHRPPVKVYRPEYYEYRKYRHKPGEKVYIRENYHDTNRSSGDYRRGKDHY